MGLTTIDCFLLASPDLANGFREVWSISADSRPAVLAVTGDRELLARLVKAVEEFYATH